MTWSKRWKLTYGRHTHSPSLYDPRPFLSVMPNTKTELLDDQKIVERFSTKSLNDEELYVTFERDEDEEWVEKLNRNSIDSS
jgi:hypothetical protein